MTRIIKIIWCGYLRPACNYLALTYYALLLIGVSGYNLGVLLGWWPMITIGQSPTRGLWLLVGTQVFMLALLFPALALWRTLELETAHYRFAKDINDLCALYHTLHAADRTGQFTATSEYDAVLERIKYCHDHCTNTQIHKALIELAAKMSYQTRHLAAIYSVEAVDRAVRFLAEREVEAQRFLVHLQNARASADMIRHWCERIELEEAVGNSQLARLTEEFAAIVPSVPEEQSVEITAAE